MTYPIEIKHPKWQKKRLKIFERDKFACRMCCNQEKTLAVHHLKYIPENKIWEYPNSLLITLCEDCHSLIHCKDKLKLRLGLLEAKATRKFKKKLSRKIDFLVFLLDN